VIFLDDLSEAQARAYMVADRASITSVGDTPLDRFAG